MHIFYYPHQAAVGEIIALDKDESVHCLKVLRHKKGDEVYATNGLGQRLLCRIDATHQQLAALSVISIENFQRNYSIHVAIAPTKQPDRIEWFLEKACELGIDEITFVECDHSVRTKLKLERAEKITISALKQSKNFHKAKINGVVKLKELVASPTASTERFIAIADQPMENHLIHRIKKSGSYLLLIGPEGDFSHSEVDQAISQGFTPVSLGDSVLRTETAGLIGCHLFHVANA